MLLKFYCRLLEGQSPSWRRACGYRGLGKYWQKIRAVCFLNCAVSFLQHLKKQILFSVVFMLHVFLFFFFSEWKYWLFGLLFHFVSSCFRCPYYLSKELHKVVDIVFAPYNYLIDRGNRKSLQLSWHNSILIFDEAHNLVRKYITNLWLENEIYCVDHILLSVNLSILYLALSFSLL